MKKAIDANLEKKIDIMNDKEKIKKLEDEVANLQEHAIEQAKLASIGKLTAGIMHEIQNPLNFINNFSNLSVSLLKELKEVIDEISTSINKDAKDEVEDISQTLSTNLEKIQQNGQRANNIIQSILLQSRGKSGAFLATNLNQLISEYANLAYHGKRAEDHHFNCVITNNFDENIGKINLVPQNFSRVILNIINNAFYALGEKEKISEGEFDPEVNISTHKENNKIIIKIRDNGIGIPEAVIQKIFNPFFSTKPVGKGTGLGLSMSYDIIKKEHKGELKVNSDHETYTEFVIEIPDK